MGIFLATLFKSDLTGCTKFSLIFIFCFILYVFMFLVLVNSTDTNSVTQGILRTCVIKAEDVDSMCDFLKEEVTPNYTITFCDVCDTDNCNDSASLSAMVGVVLLSLAGLLFK